jgi:hypothetical protein
MFLKLNLMKKLPCESLIDHENIRSVIKLKIIDLGSHVVKL